MSITATYKNNSAYIVVTSYESLDATSIIIISRVYSSVDAYNNKAVYVDSIRNITQISEIDFSGGIYHGLQAYVSTIPELSNITATDNVFGLPV